MQLFCASHFNPLPPHGGRPPEYCKRNQGKRYFNPLPPHGGRLQPFDPSLIILNISIHSLRMEGDIQIGKNVTMIGEFQSTPSAWRETYRSRYLETHDKISIHSLRMEGDVLNTSYDLGIQSFQSTPSAWRETDYMDSYDEGTATFQSTPSAWRETQWEKV